MILDGDVIAGNIYSDLKTRISNLSSPLPGLVLYCDEPDNSNRAYMKMIVKKGKELGIEVRIENAIDPVNDIKRLNASGEIAGVMIMHPLKNIDENKALETLSFEKDMEGRTSQNLGKLMEGNEFYAPPTSEAVMEILSHYNIPLKGKRVVIVGRSTTVGKPLAMLMLKKGIDGTVTVCHSRTLDLPSIVRSGDILVSAVGRAGFITKEMVNPGTAVIDVGINFVKGKLTGDVDFDEVKTVASAITPVPGGVGSVTTAILFRHVVKSLERMLNRSV